MEEIIYKTAKYIFLDNMIFVSAIHDKDDAREIALSDIRESIDYDEAVAMDEGRLDQHPFYDDLDKKQQEELEGHPGYWCFVYKIYDKSREFFVLEPC